MVPNRIRPLTAMVCDGEPARRAALVDHLTTAGFEVGELVDNGPHALEILPYSQPSVLVLVHELIGMSGLEVVPLARELEDTPEVVLIASDESIAEQARDAGAIAVVRHGDTDRLDEVLAELVDQFQTGERRGIDRREGQDRRVRQDWNKVTIERRSGTDRRKPPDDTDRRGAERRDGDDDRRVEQDWKQVTSERRSGEGRRD